MSSWRDVFGRRGKNTWMNFWKKKRTDTQHRDETCSFWRLEVSCVDEEEKKERKEKEVGLYR
jgi:hypothetical protein